MRPLSGLFLLFFALSSEVGLAHEIPRCEEGEEFNVNLKRCASPFIRHRPCSSGEARFLGVCVSASVLQLNASLEASESARALTIERSEARARQMNVDYSDLSNLYENYVAEQTAMSAGSTVTPPEPASAAVAEGTSSPNPTPAPEPEETVSDNQDNLEESFDVFDPDQCEWVPDMPRKVHEAPGCRRSSRTKVCVGYVACKLREGEGRFIRASTCSTQHCGDGPANASACTKDPGFWSNNVDESSPKYINQEIRNLINRASRQ